MKTIEDPSFRSVLITSAIFLLSLLLRLFGICFIHMQNYILLLGFVILSLVGYCILKLIDERKHAYTPALVMSIIFALVIACAFVFYSEQPVTYCQSPNATNRAAVIGMPYQLFGEKIAAAPFLSMFYRKQNSVSYVTELEGSSIVGPTFRWLDENTLMIGDEVITFP